MNPSTLSAFRLGDVRGIYPEEIDEAFAKNFAWAFASQFGIRGKVATGRDMRESSEALQTALNEGFAACGIDVDNLGLCTTELGYFASTRPAYEAIVIVTASHNPAHYNGFKCVLRNGEAVTFDTGLEGVMKLMLSSSAPVSRHSGRIAPVQLRPDYLTFLERRFSFEGRDCGRIALNGLNGTAATLAATLVEQLALDACWFRKEPGPIPREGADPANPRLAAQMKDFMQQDAFSLGIAWDGDCDRCVFFDSQGDLVPTYYVVGLLAGHFLQRRPGGAIVFDTKLCWNTLKVIDTWGGKAIPSKTGHAFMKRNMRQHHAIYGGELSSHHFFGDFFYCDSGMFAWLTMLELVSQGDADIGEHIESARREICCTPEINLRLADADAAFKAVIDRYGPLAGEVGQFDGLSMVMPGGWRFTLTRSKTEPLVRLNMESREGAQRLLDEGAALLRYLQPFEQSGGDLLEKLVIQ